VKPNANHGTTLSFDAESTKNCTYRWEHNTTASRRKTAHNEHDQHLYGRAFVRSAAGKQWTGTRDEKLALLPGDVMPTRAGVLSHFEGDSTPHQSASKFSIRDLTRNDLKALLHRVCSEILKAAASSSSSVSFSASFHIAGA